jgi:hypothetical protein
LVTGANSALGVRGRGFPLVGVLYLHSSGNGLPWQDRTLLSSSLNIQAHGRRKRRTRGVNLSPPAPGGGAAPEGNDVVERLGPQ